LAYAALLAIIWIIIGFHVLLSGAGFIYFLITRRRRPLPDPGPWPSISILVPAHNEALVLAGTLEDRKSVV
jgi:cellulose synthase/poly-beta-1,6-N-acetylglucosamine synthase-like glycosyltransferase